MNQIVEKLANVGLQKQSEELEVLAASQKGSHFRLPVMGGMKAGKSTLLAKLLQTDESFFPKDILEATARNIQVVAGPLAMRSYLAADGNRVVVQDDELWSQLVCGISSIQASDLTIELSEPLLMENDLVFVDTPGNNTIDNSKATETWNALKDSQAGIYCLKATAFPEQTDLTFLQEAKYYLEDFIFVITRLDEAGCRDVHDELATHLVTKAQKRLSELGVKPLAILPVSSKAPMEVSGLPELRKCIQDIIRTRGTKLRAHQVCLKGSRVLEQTRKELHNELELLSKAAQTTQDQFREQRAAFESRLQELDSEKQNTLRRLKGKIESLKLQSLKEVSGLSEQTLERLEERLNAIQRYSDIAETGEAILRSEIDKWRQDAQVILERLPERVSELQVESSAEFCAQLQETLNSTMAVNLQIEIPPVEEDLNAQNYANTCLENIQKEKAELLEEIKKVQEELQNEGQLAPELEQKLKEAQQAVESLTYEPIYDQVERKREGGATAFLKCLGGIADIAMIFTPISWLSVLGKVGVAGKLPKIAGLVKKGSQLSTAGKIITKRPGLPKPGTNPLEFLSLEHWGEKLGQMIDGASGSGEPEMVENQEHRMEYENTNAKLNAAVAKADSERRQAEVRCRQMQSLKEELERKNQQMDEEYKKVQKDLQTAQAEMRASGERKALLDWRQTAYAKANVLLFSKGSELLQPVRQGIEAFSANCVTQSSTDLEARLTVMTDQVTEQLKQCQGVFDQDKATQESKRQTLETQIQCLDEILGSPEEAWL